MQSITSRSLLRPFGWCVVFFCIFSLAGCGGGDSTSAPINGQGTYTFADGGRYVGEFRNGKRHGQGTRTFATGNEYVGEFRDDLFNGQGTYTFADGTRYVGEFRNAKRHGQGTYTSADGGRYVGEFRNGDFNGQGTYTFPNSGFAAERYVGEFRGSKRHGQGTLTFSDGRIWDGYWVDGEFLGTETRQTPSTMFRAAPARLQTSGVPQSEITAIERRARSGDLRAQIRLAEIYGDPSNPRHDAVQAYAWSLAAADNGGGDEAIELAHKNRASLDSSQRATSFDMLKNIVLSEPR